MKALRKYKYENGLLVEDMVPVVIYARHPYGQVDIASPYGLPILYDGRFFIEGNPIYHTTIAESRLYDIPDPVEYIPTDEEVQEYEQDREDNYFLSRGG
jgi:hypothetical protein